MAASKRFMNWSLVSFTPAGGSVTVYTGVTSVKIDSGGSLAKFAGDADRYNTTVVNDMNDPSITIECADAFAIKANPPGTVGTFAATLNDARNGTGSGAITYTAVNAVVADDSTNAAHRKYASNSLTFALFSSDGVTNPLSVSQAP